MCYNGVYNDIKKFLKSQRNNQYNLGSLADVSVFMKALYEMPRGCKLGYKCTVDAYKSSLVQYEKCTRCRSIAVCRSSPNLVLTSECNKLTLMHFIYFDCE
eukprot:m.61351 g.61351  ORF g.61351 m.61351 type:complete len:101 (+) comp11384_c0_seq10:765-1067(+)